jgi:L-asparagine transporter-like permease
LVLLNLLFPGRLRFRNRFAAGAFKAPLYPIANYACLAFFALVLVLMTRIPEFRTGAIALPLWLGGLTIAALVHARVAERRAARVASSDPSALSLERS